MDIEQRRIEVAYRIMSHLNDDEKRHGRGGLFDCGELGCCLVWSSRMRWEYRWYDLEQLPDSVLMGV